MHDSQLPFQSPALSPRRLGLWAFPGIALLLVGVALAFYWSLNRRVYAEQYGIIAAIAELKSSQIQSWRRERLKDIRRAARGPLVRRRTEDLVRRPRSTQVRAELLEQLRLSRMGETYSACLLLSPEGRALLSTLGPGPAESEASRTNAIVAAGSQEPVFSEFFTGPDGVTYLDAAAAVRDTDGLPLAIFVMRTNVDGDLFPTLAAWPIPNATAESVIALRSGSEGMVPHPLRHAPKGGPRWHEPLTRTELPAIQALLGRRGFFEGKDYRGVTVLADLRPIPDSPWFLVTKIDRDEALAHLRSDTWFLLGLTGAALLLVATYFGYAYRHRQAQAFQELLALEQGRLQAEQSLRRSEERLNFAVAAGNQGLYDLDLETGEGSVNAEYATMLGQDPATFRESHEAWLERMHPDDREPTETTYQEYLAGRREDYRVEFRQRTKAGDWIWVLSQGRITERSPEGKALRMLGTRTDITPLKQGQEALAEARERLELALKGSRDGIWDWDLIEGRGHVSDRWRELLGHPEGENDLRLERWREWIHPEDRPGVDLALRRHLESREPYSVECRMRMRTGAYRWFLNRGQALWDERGRPTRMAGSTTDIHDRKLAENYRQLDRTILQILNEPGSLEFALQRVVEEFRGTHHFDGVGIRLQKEEDYPYCIHQGFSAEFLRTENSLVGRNQEGGLCRNEDGSACLECTCGLVLSAPAAEPLLTAGGSFWTNDSAKLLEIPVGEDPRFNPRNQCIHQGYASVALVPIRSLNQVIGLLQLNDLVPGRFSAETIEILEGIGRHIGVALMRRQAEAAVRAADQRFRDLVDSTDGIVWEADAETFDFLSVSAHAERVLGYPLADWLKPGFWAEHIHPEDREQAVKYCAACTGRWEHHDFEYRFLTLEGGIVWLRDIVRVFEDDGGRRLLRGLMVDISGVKEAEARQRHLERQLQQSQKMESLGLLAGGVAHDMNNVLGAILGLATAHLELHPEGGSTYRAFETIVKASTRGGNLVKGLLGLSRRSLAENELLDLNILVRDEVQLLERTTLSRVRLELALEESLPLVRGDAGALSHVLMNLCVNAIDAMPEPGRLILRTGRCCDQVVLEVEDDGSGMPQEVLEKAMEPFFTTKPLGKGTGLGLAIVYSTVKAHGGSVDIHSTPGTGTRIILRFPAAQPATAALVLPTPTDPEAPSQKGDPAMNILLVDDDDLVASSVAELIGLLNFSTTLAASGEEALLQLEGGLEPDAVILDLNMPGLGGAGTLPRLRALRPGLPVLLATGRVEQAALDLVAAHPGVTLMSKPFTMAELRGHLQSIAARAKG